MTAPKLAPCPVCGLDASYDPALRRVRCPSQDYGSHIVRVYGRTKRAAIAKWNRAFKEKKRRKT